MADISCILHCGIYEEFVEHLDYEDVYELALVNSEWGKYLGGSFARYWQKASTETFGLRFDLARILYNGMVGDGGGEAEEGRRGCVDESGRVRSWFAYFEFMKTSELGRFLVSQKKTNKVLQGLLYNLKADLSFANSRFALQNSASLDGEVSFVKSVQEYGKSTASGKEVLEAPDTGGELLQGSRGGAGDGASAGLTSFDRVELDFGGLGRGYLWDMEVVSITSQNVVLRSELQTEDIPHWDAGQSIIEYVAVWGLLNETDHVLLYHHRNPFHRIAGEDGAQPGGDSSRVSVLPGAAKISDLKGIHYFLSSLGSFAGIEVDVNETLSKMTIYVTLQVVVILESLRSCHLLSGSHSRKHWGRRRVESIQDLETGGRLRWRRSKANVDSRSSGPADLECGCGDVSAQESSFSRCSREEEGGVLDGHHPGVDSSFLQCEDRFEECCLFSGSEGEEDEEVEEQKETETETEADPDFGPSTRPAPPRPISSKCSGSYYNIELQLMDTMASIPMYLYGDLEPASGRDLSRDFAELRVCFGRNYPSSSLIKTNRLYQAGISVIDKATGEIVFSLVFPKSKSYYDRRVLSTSRRFLKLCSYSRVYGTQVPVIDPPSKLASAPESVFSKLEILIHPQKSPAVGKVLELSVSLNMHECLALFPARKFRKFLRLQGLQPHFHQHKRRTSSSPIKSIQKH